MKKLMIITAALVFSASFASSAFAVAAYNCTGASAWQGIDISCDLGNTSSLEIKGSKSVKLSYVPSTTGGIAYSICTYHIQGNKEFGSSSGDQKIFNRAMSNSTDLKDCPAAPATNTSGSTWSASDAWTAL